MKIRIGTRGSTLATTQTGTVARTLEEAGHSVETVLIKTAGDIDRTSAFSEVGAPGIFVREIENALLEHRIDVAVHSYKDLPSQSPPGLIIAAIPERLDPADRLVVRESRLDASQGLFPLKRGTKVGTASARRTSWIRHLREDLQVDSLRGNVPTRLDRVRQGDFDAILLAASGLMRLERGDVLEETKGLTMVRLDPREFVPAPSQGALALQCREDDHATRDALAAHDDSSARRLVHAERRLLAHVQGGCDVPFGAYGESLEGDRIYLVAQLERDGHLLRDEIEGQDPESLADELWARMTAQEAPS